MFKAFFVLVCPFILIGTLRHFGAPIPMNMWTWGGTAMIFSFICQIMAAPFTLDEGKLNVNGMGIIGQGVFTLIKVAIFFAIIRMFLFGGIAYFSR